MEICNRLIDMPNVEVCLISLSDKNDFTNLDYKIKPIIVKSDISLSLYKKNIINVTALQNFIETFRPDIIHTHLFVADIVSRCCYYPSAKWFTHCHGNLPELRKFKLKTFLHKETFIRYFERRFLLKRYKINGGNSFIAISKFTQDYFRLNLKKYPIFLLPNAIDFNRFHRVTNILPDNHKLSLINIGSLVYNKNQSFLIEVVEELLKRNIDVELNLIGDGVDKTMLSDLIKEKGLTNNVHLLGKIDNVEEYLWLSHIYVHSALSEALGLTIIEAMAAGVPVVSLDGFGNRDLISNGINGFMLFSKSVNLFTEAVIELWKNQELYMAISKNAVESAKNYDISSYTEKLIDIYIS